MTPSQFAQSQGFPSEPIHTPASLAAFQAHQHPAAHPTQNPFKTDTLSAVAMDANGNISAAVTTSGMAFKAVGRVGDSPIAGGGLYADAEAGGVD